MYICNGNVSGQLVENELKLSRSKLSGNIAVSPPFCSESNALAKLFARNRDATSGGTQNSAESRRNSSLLGERFRLELRPAGSTGARLLRLR